MGRFGKAVTLLLLALTLPVVTAARADDESQQIRTLIGHTFDRPDAAVVSDPIIIEQGYAIADWVQGDNGGRALLRNHEGHWSIVLCAGDSIKAAQGLIDVGVPSPIANTLAGKLAKAESTLEPSQVERLGKFKPGMPAQDEHSGHH